MTGSTRRSKSARSAETSAELDLLDCCAKTFCGLWPVFRLLLLHSAIVIDKHQSTRILWIRIALSALIARAEVALEAMSGTVLSGRSLCIPQDRTLVAQSWRELLAVLYRHLMLAVSCTCEALARLTAMVSLFYAGRPATSCPATDCTYDAKCRRGFGLA